MPTEPGAVGHRTLSKKKQHLWAGQKICTHEEGERVTVVVGTGPKVEQSVAIGIRMPTWAGMQIWRKEEVKDRRSELGWSILGSYWING